MKQQTTHNDENKLIKDIKAFGKGHVRTDSSPRSLRQGFTILPCPPENNHEMAEWVAFYEYGKAYDAYANFIADSKINKEVAKIFSISISNVKNIVALKDTIYNMQFDSSLNK